MKIGLGQINIKANQPEKNIESMLKTIEKAKIKGLDIIAFPEMSVGGYFLGDKWLDEEFCLDLMSYNEILKKASKDIGIIFGNIYVDKNINERVNDENKHPNKNGLIRTYNAAYAFANGKEVKRVKENKVLPLGVQVKTLLPNYRIFDDQRYFFSLEDLAKEFSLTMEELTQPFKFKINGKEKIIGIELCEDLWAEDYRKNNQANNITNILIENGATEIINISSSPWTYEKHKARDKRIKFLEKEAKGKFVPFNYVNCVGAQNNGKNIITFDGGSTIYNSKGNIVQTNNKIFHEEIINNTNNKEIKRKEISKIEEKYQAIIIGIKHVKDMIGIKEQPNYVIGLSGGIDSSVVASLLSIATGPEKIIGINMPTKYNSKKTKDAAKKFAQNLGIKYEVIPLENIVKLNENIIEKLNLNGEKKKLSELNKENIQAKIRGTSILSNVAAKYGALFTNNGNKVETALGYATLYGDVGGAIAPIGDLTKAEIYEMAKFLNEKIFKREVIPNEMIPDNLYRFENNKIKPSAELKENQVDPIKIGYHCAILEAMTDYKKKSATDIMKWYVKGTIEKNLNITTDLIKRWEIDKPENFIEDLEWFDKQIQANVFKRIQSPPIILTSKSAYGFDIRESILPTRKTKNYLELKEKILQMKKYKTMKGE